MDLGRWLRSLGLQQYEAVFRENAIDETVLPDLTDQDLEKLGVLLGHRRKLLRAIASLNAAPAVPASAAPPATPICPDAAERRQVTVMFSDLVGSTALSARMDPEDLREIIAAYQKCVAETVGRLGGFVAKYMGDGVLVYFGYPQAHEDDAERAVRAGLELVAAVGSLKTRVTLQTRVGIATGLAVVGDLIGSGASQEQAIVGETPNLAARLQAIAQPNGVVIAESTRKLVGNLFELDDLGSRDLKGFAGSARAWATLRPVFAESRFEALHASGLTELVGREEELEILLRRWSKAKAGEGQVVLLAGEPGVGKSRVCQAIFGRLSSEPHMRLRYFCSPHHQNSAFYPVIIQLERAAGIRREDSVEQRLDKLEAVLAQAIREPRDAAPLLAALLSIPTCERYPSLNLSPQKQKEKTLKALLAQVEGLATRQPVMMLVEDAHWMDLTSRESFDIIIDRVPFLPVLLIITYRPEFMPPWVGRPHVTLLSLNRLSPRQRAEMIGRVTDGKALPKEIVDQISDRTDGVPLFIEELTKAILESGALRDAGDHYTIAGSLPSLAIPTSLHASLLARLDRLPPAREAAQIGADRPQQLNRVLTGQFFNRLLRGELEQAEFLAGELRRLGEAARDVSWKWNSLMRDGEVCCWLGKFIEARAYFEAALASWDPGFRDLITSPHDVYVNALIYLSRALFCLGYPAQARLRRDDALTEARRLSPYTEVYALRHAWYGDWAIEGVRSIEAMLRSAEHISVISSEQGFPMFVGAGDIMRGWCLSSVGEAKTGISLLEEGLKKYAATGTKLVIPFYLTVLAEAYGAAAQPKEGLNRLDAAKLVETTQERWAEAEMHRVRGSLLLSLGERAAAEESYCEALAVARHQSAKFWSYALASNWGAFGATKANASRRVSS